MSERLIYISHKVIKELDKKPQWRSDKLHTPTHTYSCVYVYVYTHMQSCPQEPQDVHIFKNSEIFIKVKHSMSDN